MSKYYTPSISEFRVGFEYEDKRYNYYDQNIVDWDWDKYVINNIAELEDTLEDIKDDWEDNFRVKYLDQQDIESCGFELASEDSDDLYFKGKKTLGPSASGDNWIEIELSKEDQYLYIGRAWGRGKPDILFDGKIKNISELKQVLTMISVKYIKV